MSYFRISSLHMNELTEAKKVLGWFFPILNGTINLIQLV